MKNIIILKNINAYSLNGTHFNNLDFIMDSFYIGVGTTFVNVCYALYINIFIYDDYRALV